MRTPSNRAGIPGVPVALLLALILFLGLALSPRAFEFRAWPEPSRPDVIEEVVAQPVPEAPRVEVAGVRPDGDDGRGERTTARRGALDRRRAGVAHTRGGTVRRRGSRRGARADRRARAPEVSEDTPAPPADQPPAPEEPAKVIEDPAGDTVLRPDADRHIPGNGRWGHGEHGHGQHGDGQRGDASSD